MSGARRAIRTWLDRVPVTNCSFTPRLFEIDDIAGRPKLSAEGRAAIAAELGKNQAAERGATAQRVADRPLAEKQLPSAPAPLPADNRTFAAPVPPPKDAAAASKYERANPRESFVKPAAPPPIPAPRSSHSGALPAISGALTTAYTGTELAYLDDDDDEFVDAIDTQS